MNGRIYDPGLGRFLQADPHIQAPNNSQSYNRYSYVLNNPLSYTDPSGYLFKSLFKAIGKVKWLSTVISVALNFIPGCQGWCSAVFNAAVNYAVTGSLKGALIGAFVSMVSPTGFNPTAFIARGVLGGLASKAQGGKFGHGFIAAGASGAANGIKNIWTRIIASAVIGGTVSKITGGKFANGAASAAFATIVTAATNGEFNRKKTVEFEWDGNYEVGSPEWEAREQAAMDAEIAAIEASFDSGQDLYAANNDWLEPFVPDAIFDNVLSSDANVCRMTCINRHYGESYHYAGFVASQGIPGFAGKQVFEHYEELLSGSGTRRLNGNHYQFKDGQRMIRTLKQAKIAAGALAVAAAGAKGYQAGAWGYCTVQCWGDNGD